MNVIQTHLKKIATGAAVLGLLVPVAAFADRGELTNSPTPLNAVYNVATQSLVVGGSYTNAPIGHSEHKRAGFGIFINSATPETALNDATVLDKSVSLLPYLSASGSFSKTYNNLTVTPTTVCAVLYDVNVDDDGVPTDNNGGDHSMITAGPSHNGDNTWNKKIVGDKEQDSKGYATGECVTPSLIGVNTPPAIVLNGANPLTLTLGSVYAELGAIANDAQDGLGLVVTNITGAVNSLVIGTYHVFYNYTDLGGLSAPQADRTVNVVAGSTQCSDGIDNDGDDAVDYPADAGCLSYSDDSENQPPVITVTGSDPMQLVVNVDTYTEEGATADDAEDGSGLTVTDIDSSAVDTSTVGAYLVRYNYTDFGGAAAAEAYRTVNVVAGENECNDGKDNDGDDAVDYPNDKGCSSFDDTSENQAPVVTIDIPEITVPLNGSFTPPTGVHATDAEDGDISVDVVNNPVDTSAIDDYTVTYGATDSDGASAETKTQMIHVRAQCGDDTDNDDDDLVDANDPGCHTDGNVNNEGSYDPADNNETDPADLCSNIQGIQVSIPEGMVSNDGVCTTPEQPVDLCSNIEGVQATVPEGMTSNDGVCTEIPVDEVDVCSNIEGVQTEVPAGKTLRDGICKDGSSTRSGGRPQGDVLGASTGEVLGESCGLYMDQHLKKGSPKNNAAQVTKLQAFLVKHGFATFAPTGYFGPLTEKALKDFQQKYADAVLKPWNVPAPTGLAYLTTLRQINLIECPDLMIEMPALIEWSRNPKAQ